MPESVGWVAGNGEASSDGATLSGSLWKNAAAAADPAQRGSEINLRPISSGHRRFFFLLKPRGLVLRPDVSPPTDGAGVTVKTE